jgi:tetraacyldisaccharide 4'-kinase
MIWLKPLDVLYRLVVWVRNVLYDLNLIPTFSLPGTVISIGNIALGGTGKSPLVISIARRIREMGGEPVILTRGYKSGLRSGEWQVYLNGRVVAGTSRASVKPDEAVMQSRELQNTYVIVGSRRYAAAMAFLKDLKGIAPTHWILDDGFQHRRLKRDHDVVILDARCPWGPCLPAGRFREPSTALVRATTVVVGKSNSPEQIVALMNHLRSLYPKLELCSVTFKQGPLRLACGQAPYTNSERFALVCGVANPDDVANQLRSSGVNLVKVLNNPDHSSFNVRDVLAERLSFTSIITTEKDWARDQESFESLGIPVYVVPLLLDWVHGPPKFLTDNSLITNG